MEVIVKGILGVLLGVLVGRVGKVFKRKNFDCALYGFCCFMAGYILAIL